MNLPLPGADALTTVAGAAIVVTVLFEVLKRAIKPSPDTLDRFGPLAAIALGIIVVIAASFAFNVIADGAGLFVAAYNGAMSGLVAIGFFKVADNTIMGN